MKYYVIEIAEGDEKISGKSIAELSTRNEAVALYHSKMGIAMKSEMYTSELITVINSEGGVELIDKFERPVA